MDQKQSVELIWEETDQTGKIRFRIQTGSDESVATSVGAMSEIMGSEQAKSFFADIANGRERLEEIGLDLFGQVGEIAVGRRL